MAKEGSTVSGLMDSLATMTSIALQYGVPLRDLVNKFAHMRFEPAGFTGNAEIPIAKSIVDYVFRWMGSRFLSKDDRDALGIIARDDVPVAVSDESSAASATAARGGPAAPVSADDAPAVGRPARGSKSADDEPPKATAVATSIAPETGGEKPLPVLSNGNGNGHTNGHTEASLSPIKPHRPGRRDEGRFQRECGLTVLRRLRLDHGPQRSAAISA